MTSGVERLIEAAEALDRAVAHFGPMSEVSEALGALGSVTIDRLIEQWRPAAPVEVSLPFGPGELWLFPPEEVWPNQAGYRWNALRPEEAFDDWAPEWIVIGAIDGDPVLARGEGEGVDILLAVHGMGAWRPELVAHSFDDFAAALAAWLETLAAFGGERLDEATDFAVKPGFDEQLAEALAPVLSPRCIANLLAYLST